MKICIYVATHKANRMPQDEMYVPLHVGAIEKKPLYEITDATGENISKKNPRFCELTGLYWLWKHADAPYLGIIHYRRYFANRLWGEKWKRVMTHQQMERALSKADAVLPKRRHYVIETNWSHYAHAHHEEDLVCARTCISELFPAYLPTFDKVMRRTSGHRFNMMVMRKSLLDAYCEWLFPVLFAMEEKLDISDYSTYDSRVFGFVSERLLDVWLVHNHIRYVERPVVNMDSQHWPRKVWLFLKRKYAGK